MIATFALAATLAAGFAAAQVPYVLVDMRGYFYTDDPAREVKLVQRLRANKKFDRAATPEQMHQLRLHEKLDPGRLELQLPVGFGQTRVLTLRVPAGYDPDSGALPLIYALHPSGGSGPGMVGAVEKLLGPKVEGFLVAAPSNYRQTIVDAPPPFTPEHPLLLRALRKKFHVDSDRVYALGYSLGGYTAWTLATLHADDFAGAVALASTFSAPADAEGLWEALAPNMAAVPVLHVWGLKDRLDVPGFEGRKRTTGTISKLNRRLSPRLGQWAETWGVEVIDRPLLDTGHLGAEPTAKDLESLLARERVHYPPKVEHRFRHLHQAGAYWLEAHAWDGESWGGGLEIEKQRGENLAEATGRTVLGLLGTLRGTIEGQAVRVETRHVADLTVWFGDGMIDWEQPIELIVDGKALYKGRVWPDIGICLAQAKRTGDLDRLRWAGIRVSKEGKVRLVSERMEFPGLLPESP